jgi:tetratricopeptide (TPR) repeat protein
MATEHPVSSTTGLVEHFASSPRRKVCPFRGVRVACHGLTVAGVCLVLAGGCNTLSSRASNAAGVRQYQLGAYPTAIQNFQQAIHRNPISPDGYYNMAATLHKSGKLNQNAADLEQAESYYNQCLDRAPNHADCYRGLAVLLVEQQRDEEAFKLLEGWAMRSPTLADPKVELARLYQEYNDRESAKEHLLDALAVAPNDARALAAMGKIREEEGDFVQALIDYQRSLMHNKFQPEVAARIAQLQPIYGPRVTPPTTVGGVRTVSSTMPTIR